MTPKQTSTHVITIRETKGGLWELKHSAYPEKLRWLCDTKEQAEEKAATL